MKSVPANQESNHRAAMKQPLVTDKAVKVLAGAIYRQLQDEGCDMRNIISVSTQLLDLVTTELQKDGDQEEAM